jgi:cellulose synthase/poly-beta-1,6-N-acetylglucosamine synthase-like glycosyltransferase
MPLSRRACCTVCIPTYNQSKYLQAAVESIAAQTAPVALLVSNDASPDDTAEVIARLTRQHTFDAVNHTVNRGISQHLQWLLRQPQTQYIMRLDSDDLLYPEYIATLTALLDRHPSAGYAHCAIQEIDAAGGHRGLRLLARTHEFEDAETALRRSVGGYQVSANVIVFRREALESVNFGGGAENLNFVEDFDLSVRLADAGWGNVYSPQVLAAYRVHEGAERPRVDRKLKEVRGLTTIFSGSLTTAFARRGWDLATLRDRRRQLALDHADILDNGSFAPGERDAMQRALEILADDPALRPHFRDTRMARLVRWARAQKTHLLQRAKQAVKRVVRRTNLKLEPVSSKIPRTPSRPDPV